MARKRRGRGEGSVYQRNDGIWCGSVSAGQNAKGKRRRKTVYGRTKQEALDKLREAQKTGIPETTTLTVSDHLGRWLETSCKPRLATATVVRYEQVIRLHINPHIGRMKLAKLQPLHIEHLYLEQKKQRATTRQRELSGVVLQKALRHAVRMKLIPFNPCPDVEKPRSRKSEMKVWTHEQVRAFLDAASGDRLHALYCLAIASGMRQGELFALEWPDIDFEGAAVSVQRTLEEIHGRLRVKEPKTARSRRRIDLPQFTLDALHEHRKRMLADGHTSAPVFCDVRGGYLRKSNVYRRSFKPLMGQAQVPTIRFHDMRHTSATLLLLLGENPKVVSERLGHASIEVTLNTYSHVLPTMQKAAADKLDRLFA